MKTISLYLTIAVAQIGNLLAQDSSDVTKSHTQRVAFAQSCFWTGEMKLGRIEGVVRTEAGYFKGREVTLVEYAPQRITLEDLARQAKEAGVADRIHLEPGVAGAVLGVASGAALDQSYRPAPASDQKKQIDGTPFSRLQLSPEQATKVNAYARSKPAAALQWLTPEQQKLIREQAILR